ncbi:hypothetical protein SAMN05192544_104576 [Paraburkholderia hospita]|nr:hypothetical protein SAMN05192544_104576 [Paraburkholderia hospita]
MKHEDKTRMPAQRPKHQPATPPLDAKSQTPAKPKAAKIHEAAVAVVTRDVHAHTLVGGMPARKRSETSSRPLSARAPWPETRRRV